MTTFLLILAPIAAFAADIAVLVALRRAVPALNYLLTIILAFAAGFAVLLLISLYGSNPLQSMDDLGTLILNFLAYGGLGYGLFTFVNLSATSLRIRIIRAIHSSKSGSLDEKALLKLYDSGSMVDARLGRLIAWRQVENRGGRYFASPDAAFAILHGILAIAKRLIYGANRAK